MKIIAIVLLFLMSTAASAATLVSKDAARKLTDDVVSKISSGDLDGGFLLVKPHLIVPESEFNVMLEQAKLQLPMIQGRYGKSLGAEYIKEKMIGMSLLQIIQIQKFERHIIRWKFTFYNPDGKWVLDSFIYDDNISSLFEE